jgi:hypothetical protein
MMKEGRPLPAYTHVPNGTLVGCWRAGSNNPLAWLARPIPIKAMRDSPQSISGTARIRSCCAKMAALLGGRPRAWSFIDQPGEAISQGAGHDLANELTKGHLT